jgi:regulatory protein
LKGLPNKARQYALKLLSYRGRSEKELEERLLKKGVTKPVVSSTINELKEIGVIDDMSLAEALKRQALTTKMLSQNGAKRYMQAKGIPRDIIDVVFYHDKNKDFDNALRLAGKKLMSLNHYPSEIVKRRLYNLLLRRGYSSETIMKVLKDISNKEE